MRIPAKQHNGRPIYSYKEFLDVVAGVSRLQPTNTRTPGDIELRKDVDLIPKHTLQEKGQSGSSRGRRTAFRYAIFVALASLLIAVIIFLSLPATRTWIAEFIELFIDKLSGGI